MINGHENDLHNYNNIIADFSSNVWFEGPAPELLNHLCIHIKSIANYPEPNAISFAQKTAEFYNLPNTYCIATNGSVEAFYLIAQALNKKTASIITPAFAEYTDACKQYNIETEYLDIKTIKSSQQFNTELVWLGNPNNPDGKVTPVNTIECWLKKHPYTTIIIDEAYAELCTEFKSSIGLIKLYKNLIITKSFTKAFAIPGLRLGTILTSDSHIQKLNSFQIPWTVNSMAISAGNYIIDNYNSLLLDKKTLSSYSKLLQNELNSIHHINVVESKCNYFLAETDYKTASELKDYLANQHGLLIRDASNFQGLSAGHFRIAIQSSQKNKLLIQAIKQWIQ